MYSSTAKTLDAPGTSGPRRPSTSQVPGWTKASTRWEHFSWDPFSSLPSLSHGVSPGALGGQERTEVLTGPIWLRDRLAVSPGHCLRGEEGRSGDTVHGNALPGPAPVPELSSPQASWQGNSRPSCPRLQSRPSPAQPEKQVGGEGGPLPEELPGSVAAAVHLHCSRGRDGGSGWDCPLWG